MVDGAFGCLISLNRDLEPELDRVLALEIAKANLHLPISDRQKSKSIFETKLCFSAIVRKVFKHCPN